MLFKNESYSLSNIILTNYELYCNFIFLHINIDLFWKERSKEKVIKSTDIKSNISFTWTENTRTCLSILFSKMTILQTHCITRVRKNIDYISWIFSNIL